jgi:hypothetical protein
MDLVPCAHCSSSGSCASGENQAGCARCQDFWSERGKQFAGLSDRKSIVCSVCWGKGLAEPSNQKWQYRFPAMLALLIVVSAVFLLCWFANNSAFDKIIVFVGTLVGSVTGYYFGGERRGASVVLRPKGNHATGSVTDTSSARPLPLGNR